MRPGLSVVQKIVHQRTFGTTNSLQGQKAIRFLKAQKKKQQNEAKQANIKNALDTVDPVMGRQDTPFVARIMAELKEPSVLSSGYEIGQVEKVFAAIEAAKSEQLKLSNMNEQLMESESEESLALRRDTLLRILNMRNSDNKNSLKLALSLSREEFQRCPGDTGSPEVQAACMTIRIHNLAAHIKEHQKDFANIRVLRTLVQQRQSILKYLKKSDPEKYYWAIQKLGLTDNAVLSEFNMDRKYMQDYKFFGDKILVKESKREADQKRKEIRKQKRVSKLNTEEVNV